MIISGGENIYCAEVEDVLAAHPKVAEVALIGVPRRALRRGAARRRSPRATRPTRRPPPSSTAWCREQLAAYKCPRDVAVVGALPRNPSGKVLKTQLRAEHGAAAVASAPAV